jgi:hypothetical protein
MLTDTKQILGAATVVETGGDRLVLRREDGEECFARMALAYPYSPATGDLVLAIGEEEVFVIGVLVGRGKTLFESPGELELRAKKINIVGEESLELQSPDVTIKADRFETIAQKAHENFISVYRWVKETFQTRAGRVRTIVDGQHTLRADRINEHAKNEINLRAKGINLG